MIPAQHAPGNNTPTTPAPATAPVGAGASVADLYAATAAPAAHSGNGSSFTPLHEVPRFDLYCRADAIGTGPWSRCLDCWRRRSGCRGRVAVTAQAWDDVIGWPTEGTT